jgi:hypothetical protein
MRPALQPAAPEPQAPEPPVAPPEPVISSAATVAAGSAEGWLKITLIVVSLICLAILFHGCLTGRIAVDERGNIYVE